MGKALDKLKQLRDDLVGAQKQIEGATAMGKAQLLKVLIAHGIKAESVLEFSLDKTGVFLMGGKKYAFQVESDGITYGLMADQGLNE